MVTRLVRSKQLDLFGGALDAIDRVPLAFDAERELSTRVPEHVRFGTSSWTFRGWGGLVYPVGTTDDELGVLVGREPARSRRGETTPEEEAA